MKWKRNARLDGRVEWLCEHNIDHGTEGHGCDFCCQRDDFPGNSRTRVVNVKASGFDVYIGRPSIWGNPFKMRDESERGEVIKQYRNWILQRPDLLTKISTLKGKVLGCYCKPKACHGDVLADIAEKGVPTFLDQFESIKGK